MATATARSATSRRSPPTHLLEAPADPFVRGLDDEDVRVLGLEQLRAPQAGQARPDDHNGAALLLHFWGGGRAKEKE
jgi:hypothetical protein